MHSSRRTAWSTTILPLFVGTSTVSQLTLLSTLCGLFVPKKHARKPSSIYILTFTGSKKHSHVKFYRVVIFQFSKRREGSDNKTNGCHALMSIAHTQ